MREVWFNSAMTFRTIALIGKYQSPEIGETLRTLANFLRGYGGTVLIEQGTASSTGTSGFPIANYEEIGARADLAVILGGDGTMLNTARRMVEYGVPLVGINQGRLGFMTDISRHDMLERFAELLQGHYTTDRRFLLEATILRGGECALRALALNDVVVNKGELGRMIEFEVKIDSEFIYNQRSDGMIVCTPTGSTAYALSANGPILHPAVPGIALVPLCPHALSNRPITVSDGSTIEITLVAPHDARVHFDGQTSFDARAGDCVRIARSAHSVTLLHPPGYSYFAMLREKLRWSEAPRNHTP